jgi:hypothetical protein
MKPTENTLAGWADVIDRIGNESRDKKLHARKVYEELNITLSPEVIGVMDLVHEIDSLQRSLTGMGMSRDAEEVAAMAERLPKAIAELEEEIS